MAFDPDTVSRPLRIHVKGTVQEPKVQAQTFGTFTTTVDEVLKGDPPPKAKKK